MCLKKFKDLENLNRFELKDYDLIVVNTTDESKVEKIKYLIKIIPRFIVEDNAKVAILNSNIPPKVIYTSIINKQIEINKLRKLSQQQSKIKIENIKNVIKSNLYLNYITETTIDEVIEKCEFLKNEKRTHLIIISNVGRIKDFNEENKYTFFNKLEVLSKKLEITIMITI